MRLFEGTEFDIPPKCERCDQLEIDCQCPPLEPASELIPRSKQFAKVYSERRKHGKTVTCVKDIHENDLADVLTKLKNQLGCGGTVKNEKIELQGDHSEAAIKILKKLGFRIRK